MIELNQITNEPYKKAVLCELYKISSTKLRTLMNVVFYDELVLVGYNKNDKIVSPRVVKKFVELWGTAEEHLI